MAAENRPTFEQLAALAPGDPLVIETSGDFRRPRHPTGTVVRVEGPHIVVRTSGLRGGSYIERYGRRDGVRVGGGGRAELVNVEQVDAVPTQQRQQALLIDAAYREWSRNRGDVEKLRRLHAAIEECLEELAATVQP